MEYSCLKTLAGKFHSSTRKILRRYKDGSGEWGIPYETRQGAKRMYFANYQDCKDKPSPCQDVISNRFIANIYARNSLEDRLKAKVCELCGKTDAESYELHHVRKVKDLKGKAKWEQCMIAKRRKTLVVCKECHKAIHRGKM